MSAETCSICARELDENAPRNKTAKKILPSLTGRICSRCYQVEKHKAKREKKITRALSVLMTENKLDTLFASGNYSLFVESMAALSDQVESINNQMSHLVGQLRALDAQKARVVDLIIHANNMAATIPSLRYPDARKEANDICSDPVFRRSVFAARGYECAHCGTRTNLTIDHIIPVVLGGSSELTNLQVLCRPCNSRKGSRSTTYANREANVA